MIARIGLAMVTYVTVGMLLALGHAVAVPEDFTVVAGSKVASRPPPPVPVEPRPHLVTDGAATVDPGPASSATTTSTVHWASGRLSDAVVRSEVPVSIELPALHIVANVVPKGIDPASGQMAIPATPDEVGWYRFGARPGDPGSAVLAGHVDMAGYGPGAFFELDRLLPGSEVIVHMSDGTSRRLEVVETTRVPKAQLDLDAVFDNTGPARVTLITCGGAFNRTDRTYNDNVVSSLRPVGDGA